MILTCLVTIMMAPNYNETRPLEAVETAVSGEVLGESGGSVLLDFSKYATNHRYDVRASTIWVSKDACMDKELK